MHRPRAAKGDQREMAGIVAAFHADVSNGAHHVIVHDLQYAVGSPVQVQAKGSADLLLYGGSGSLDVQGQGAAGDGVVDAAQHQVGVRDRWLGPSHAVADRAGRGAGAARPHVQVARRRQPRDAAAARADSRDVQHR